MPPRFKYTREQIIQAAFDLAREGGISAVTAKGVGAKLNASVKVVFGQFSNMEQVKHEVQKEAYRYWRSYIQAAMEKQAYPPYAVSGMAYIHFAKEEKALFKLLFMRDRSAEDIDDSAGMKPVIAEIQRASGLSAADAYMVHTEMWMFVHGIATMAATVYLDWNDPMIFQFLTDAYMGLKHRFSEKTEMQTAPPENTLLKNEDPQTPDA